MERLHREEGIALAAAMYALIVVGGLVSAAFFVSVLEQRLGFNALKLNGAFAAADGGAAEIVSQWSSGGYDQLAVGETATLGQRWVGQSGWYGGTVRRLARQLFLITIDAYSRDSTARQRVGLLVRSTPVEVDLRAALTTRGPVRLGTSASVSGNDEPPSGWTGCEDPRSPLPALRLPPADSAAILSPGCTNYGCLSGTPKIRGDSTINDVSFSDLAALASRTLPGGSYSEIGPRADADGCDWSHPQNWGDPLSPGGSCSRYFPLIFIGGNASIQGTAGQGVLVVDGNLRVDGDLQFYGAVIVRGTLSITGGRVSGGVSAGGASLEASSVLGEAVVRYSSCVLERALDATAPAAPLEQRAWINPY